MRQATLPPEQCCNSQRKKQSALAMQTAFLGVGCATLKCLNARRPPAVTVFGTGTDWPRRLVSTVAGLALRPAAPVRSALLERTAAAATVVPTANVSPSLVPTGSRRQRRQAQTAAACVTLPAQTTALAASTLTVPAAGAPLGAANPSPRAETSDVRQGPRNASGAPVRVRRVRPSRSARSGPSVPAACVTPPPGRATPPPAATACATGPSSASTAARWRAGSAATAGPSAPGPRLAEYARRACARPTARARRRAAMTA